MKQIMCVLAVLALMPLPAMSAERETGRDIVVKSEQQSAFKGLLYSVWGKLRALSPKPAGTYRNRSVVTAGVRGAETTTSLMSPYWKDDKTEDPDYIRELTEFTRAQQLAEEGDLQAAVKALSAFVEQYGNSDLRPNAQFALGVSYGGMGDNRSAVGALQSFINDNPGHPLAVDARQVIAELK